MTLEPDYDFDVSYAQLAAVVQEDGLEEARKAFRIIRLRLGALDIANTDLHEAVEAIEAVVERALDRLGGDGAQVL